MTPQEIEQILDMLAEKLGPYAEMVWGVYVRQVYVGVAKDVFLALLFFACGAAGVWLIKMFIGKWKKGKSYDDCWDIAAIITLVVTVFCFALGFLGLSGLFNLLNPEYHAIQMLLGR